LFHKLPRQRFFDRLFKFPSIPIEGLVVPVETSDKLGDFVLAPSEVFGLVVVHMANEAEQACLADGRPGVWLARVSELGTQLRKAKGLVPSVFDKCSVSFSSNDELQLSESYLKGFDNISIDLSAAETHFARCSQICPWIAEPLILRAYLNTLEGDTIGGCELSVQAINILDQWGTAWDNRLSWSEWKHLAEVLLNQIEPEHFNDLTADSLKEPRTLFNQVATRPAQFDLLGTPKPSAKMQSELSAGGSRGQLAPTRLERYIGYFADAASDSLKRVYPELASQPWHDPKGFPIVPALEDAYEQIKEEVMRLQDEDFHQESETIGRVGAWDVFFFYERGNKNIGNCARCPTITAIVEQHETLRTQAGLIYLSRLRSGTHIAPHRGPTNLRVRCHLGIQVPEGDCRLRVGNEVGAWTQGRCIVFDDYYEHEAWNRTAEDRIVLIVDLWHPAFTTHERDILKGLHQYAFAHAQGLHRYWI
jgi:aspartate beta-hydroxylase